MFSLWRRYEEDLNLFDLITKMRQKQPLVHNITNVVVTNFVANGLLSIGASPVMAYAKEEVADMAAIADALVLNIGTLSTDEVEAMIIAGKAANSAGTPVVFDPVGAGATAYRTEMSQKILKEVKVDIIRGNAAEVANLIGEKSMIKGVDAVQDQKDSVKLAEKAANLLNCAVVITGKIDVISSFGKTNLVANGHPLLTKVTGTGCLLSSVVAAFAAVEKNFVTASTVAVSAYGIAAEKAANLTEHKGPGSFQIEFLDQLSQLTEQDQLHAKIEKLGN